MTVMATRALEMQHDEDPKLVIQREWALYSASYPQVMGARLIVGVYRRPEKLKSGIILSDKSRDEDNYQGRVGLVLAMGPLAFVEDDRHSWPGRHPQVGDWIGFRVGDTSPFLLPNGRHCRFVEDVAVQVILSDPDHIL